MNTVINKVKTAVSTVALFSIGCVMAGLGFAVVGMLALFALFTVGLAFIAAPFVSMGLGSNDSAAQDDATTVAA